MRLGDRAARAAYEAGLASQARGDLTEAAAAYGRLGPRLAEFLRQGEPAGDGPLGPHFLIVGPGRSGTTWFKRRLADHPQVFMLRGEHNYFSNGAAATPPHAYVRSFSSTYGDFKRPRTAPGRPVPPGERIYGEKSPTYISMADGALDLCAVLFPHVRLICTVRDPVARAISHLKRMKPGRLRNIRRDLAEGGSSPELEQVIAQGRYAHNLARWARRIAPSQILLVDFRRLATDPAAVYAETLDHIGAGPLPGPVELGALLPPTPDKQLPRELVARIEAAYAAERFDLDWLRKVMTEAAAQGRTGPGAGRSASAAAAVPPPQTAHRAPPPPEAMAT